MTQLCDWWHSSGERASIIGSHTFSDYNRPIVLSELPREIQYKYRAHLKCLVFCLLAHLHLSFRPGFPRCAKLELVLVDA